jgi:C4-dicarboxylate-binding protein DctP
MQMLQLGSVQMLAPSVSKFGPLGVRAFEVFDLPFIFDDDKDLHNVTQGRIGQQLFKMLESKGITGLAYWDNGFKQMSSNKPLKTPADFRGQKIRIQSSKVLDGQMRALGATPQVMAFSEVYQALQTGVVDGQENTWSNIYTQKFYEVQKYITVSNHGVIEYAVIVNKKFWDGLPADIRATLDGAMKDATTYANDIAKQENDDALEKIKASGKSQIITLTPEEKKAWKKAELKVHRENEGSIGKDLIQEIYKDTGFDPSKL